MPPDTIQGVTVSSSESNADSPFKDSPRVIYGKNPLISVTCQLRFTPVLKIESDVPAEFQEGIRGAYPLLKERVDPALNLPANIPEPMAALLKSQFGAQRKHAGYDFVSEDDKWTATLTRDSLSVAAANYKTWEDFQDHLRGPLAALIKVYAPAFITRVGLRYQNLIQRSKLGLTGAAWNELLQAHILGLLAHAELDVPASQSESVVQFSSDRGYVKIRNGLVRVAEAQEDCYLIDNDFSIDQRIATDGTLDSLTFFNAQSGRLFRWCIDDKLHNAMEPGNPG